MSERKSSKMDFDSSDVAYTPTTGVGKVFEIPLLAATAENLNSYPTGPDG
jgi:hypothetical protein